MANLKSSLDASWILDDDDRMDPLEGAKKVRQYINSFNDD